MARPHIYDGVARAAALALAASCLASLPRRSAALTLRGGPLTVELDAAFPRPLRYTHAATGDAFRGALAGAPGFHLSLSLNAGQAHCGEASISTLYVPLPLPPGEDGADFSVSMACSLNWPDAAESSSSSSSSPSSPPPTTTTTFPRRAAAAAPPFVFVELNGTVIVRPDPAAPASAGVFAWTLISAVVGAGSAPGFAAVTSLDVSGFELASFAPVPAANTSACFHVPDENGNSPRCGGDSYFVDAWSNVALDEWYTGTWASSIVMGSVDINTPAGGSLSCMDGAASRLAPGPLASIIAGGWSASGKTGLAALSSNKHLPFSTGPRAFDAPGRCSHFTIAPSRINTAFLCGSTLPFSLSVGVFSDLTADGAISSDDVFFWRRHQFPRADVLYRSTLPYKLGMDYTAYVPQSAWARLSFDDALAYATNMSAIFDSYPQTPILVGWQGLGHDTLYPALDVVNARCGGAAGLAAYAAGLTKLNSASSVSYHVNSDEAYSHFNGAPNPEFDVGICRLQVDHVTPWFSNCSVTHEQVPDCGIRCSISKTRDAVSHGRYARMGKMFDVVPAGMRTVHSDAWRDVGASWEKAGYISSESENFCGQIGDRDFWLSHGGVTLGNEGENGQAAEMLGAVTFEYHGDGYDVELWARIVTGSSLGFDTDVYCYAPGGLCSGASIADRFWLSAKLYQLALTDELLGEGGAADSGAPPHHRFLGGGRILKAHANRRAAAPRAAAEGGLGPPSVWPYGGDSIPVARGSGVFVPLVQPDGTLSPSTAHAYVASNAQPQPPLNKSCALFSSDPAVYTLADNVCVGDWNLPTAQFELDPSIPEAEAALQCKAACDGNGTACDAFDMIKVTPYSGKTKPLCMLYQSPEGCGNDDNQVAGVKAPLPLPPPSPSGELNQTWTLPLSWVGKTLTATAVAPGGESPAQFALSGRELTVINMTPGVPVRFVAAM